MRHKWVSELFPGNCTPTMDSPENIRCCLNCELPVECCNGNYSTCRAGRAKASRPHTNRGKRLSWTPDMVRDVVEGRKTQHELAYELGVAQSTVHRVIKKMEEEGKL